MAGARFVFKLFVLTILLNLVRYFTLPRLVEPLLIFPGLLETMERNPGYFRTEFSSLDWITSYLSSFFMWFATTTLYSLAHGQMTGHPVLKSLKVYEIFWLLFASISFVYMNHYSHPAAFYLWNVADAALVMPTVAVANGILYPRFFRDANRVGA